MSTESGPAPEKTSSPAPAKTYHVVAGFDLSELSTRAVEEALALAAHHPKAEVHVITIAEPAGVLVRLPGVEKPLADEAAKEAVRERVAKIVDDYQTNRGPLSLERVGVYVISGTPPGEPSKLIVDLAQAVDAELIVIGTHGRKGVERMLLGSVASEIVRTATTNVYVVRPIDFVRGKKVPAIEPPLAAGAPHLKHFEHRRTFHYVDRVAPWTQRTMPAS